VPLRLVEYKDLSARDPISMQQKMPLQSTRRNQPPLQILSAYKYAERRPNCTHNCDRLVISPTVSGNVPLRLVEANDLHAPRPNQRAIKHTIHCSSTPAISHRCRDRSTSNTQIEGQTALTTVTAESSRRQYPAMCRSGSWSTTTCPDARSSQHTTTHAIAAKQEKGRLHSQL
jgi:hypothetical protein